MRSRAFVLPNFLATVRFIAQNDEVKMLRHGTDEAAVGARLKARYPGAQVVEVAPYDFATGWGRKAAERLTSVETAIAARQKYDFSKNSIWGELKDFLFDHFDGTCAYCECDLLDTSFGSVEHYRPKSPVLGESNHPGYYWLAFDAANYLPTCNRCNTAKSNKFPIVPGSLRAAGPGEEVHEKPLLLNPYHLSNSLGEHVQFVSASEVSVGPVAKGVSEAGRVSIDLLDLNRPDLVPQRLHEQERAAGEYFTQRSIGLKPPPVLVQLMAGSRPFSAASLAAVSVIDQTFPTLGG